MKFVREGGHGLLMLADVFGRWDPLGQMHSTAGADARTVALARRDFLLKRAGKDGCSQRKSRECLWIAAVA